MGDLYVFMKMYSEECILLVLSNGTLKESLTGAMIFGILFSMKSLTNAVSSSHSLPHCIIERHPCTPWRRVNSSDGLYMKTMPVLSLSLSPG